MSRIETAVLNNINNYFNLKIMSLLIHSQTQAILTGNIAQSTNELHSFFIQDPDIEQIQLLNTKGQELIHMTRGEILSQNLLTNQSQNPIFHAITQTNSKLYISPVTYSALGSPQVFIAVPVLTQTNTQSIEDLDSPSGFSYRATDLKGILIEEITIEDLFDYLNTIHIGKNGYLFLVDNHGTIINHPDNSYVTQGVNLSQQTIVHSFLSSLLTGSTPNTMPVEATNESGNGSLMLVQAIPNLNWDLSPKTQCQILMLRFYPPAI